MRKKYKNYLYNFRPFPPKKPTKKITERREVAKIWFKENESFDYNNIPKCDFFVIEEIYEDDMVTIVFYENIIVEDVDYKEKFNLYKEEYKKYKEEKDKWKLEKTEYEKEINKKNLLRKKKLFEKLKKELER